MGKKKKENKVNRKEQIFCSNHLRRQQHQQQTNKEREK